MADDFRSEDPGHLVAAPLEALIIGIGRAVGEAQRELDHATAESIRAMGMGDDARLERLRRLGYQPTWFRIPEVDAELTVALSLHAETVEDLSSMRLYAAPVDAAFTNRYGYDMNAASTVRFKVVPVPAPPRAEEVKIVPSIVNKRWTEAKVMLQERGIAFRIVPDEPNPKPTRRVSSTQPKAGSHLDAGGVVDIKLKGR